MLFDGIKLVEGSEFQNLVVDTGSSFPSLPAEGEMFYRNDGANEGLYVYDGADWIRQVGEGDSIDTLLPDVGTPGTYKSVTVDAKGRVTAGTSPTTLSGFGIADAQPLDGDLTAIANIAASTGLLRKTASNTWTLDTDTYITGNQNITVTGDVTGSGTTAITLNLGTTGVAAGSYGTASAVPTVAIDNKGRIASAINTPIAIDTSAVTSGSFANARISEASVTQHQAALSISESQIADGAILARLAGNETISGAWTFNNPLLVASPSSASHAATKQYVDNAISGLDVKQAVRVATTASITLSGTQTIDGVALDAGDRVLVKDQTPSWQNGIYVVAAGAWSRATDADNSPDGEVTAGMYAFIEEGSVNADTGWMLTTSNPILLDTTLLAFAQFTGTGQINAGAGLTKGGSTLDIGTASSTRIVVNIDNIDLATVTDSGTGTFKKIAIDGYGRVTGTEAVVASDITGLIGASNVTIGSTTIALGATSTSLTGLSSVTSTTFVGGLTGLASLNLPLTGGTLTGDVTLSYAIPNITLAATASNYALLSFNTVSSRRWTIAKDNTAEAGSNAGSNFVINRYDDANTLLSSPFWINRATGHTTIASLTVSGGITGNAATATTLETGRTISISGDGAGTSAAFDGSANANISLTLNNVNSNTGAFGSASVVPVITVNAKGLITAVSTASITAGATVAGASTQIQYNTSGALDASDGLTFTAGTSTLTVGTTSVGGVIGGISTSLGSILPLVTIRGNINTNSSGVNANGLKIDGAGTPTAGGVVTITGGVPSTSGYGGAVTISGGEGGGSVGGSGGGGAINIAGGSSSAAVNANGADVNISGGQGKYPQSWIYGGNVIINGGITSLAGANGGDVIVKTAGVGTGSTLVERFRIKAGGAWSVGSAGTNVGTAAQVLTSNGSASPPTWQAVSIANGMASSDFAYTPASSVLLWSPSSNPELVAGGSRSLLLKGGSASGAAGQVIISGGIPSSSGHGGAIQLISGSATSSGTGGAMTIQAGAGAGTLGGGTVSIAAGAAPSTGTGGSLQFSAGGSSGGTPGNISLTAGSATGAGTGGSVTITGGSTSASGTGGVVTLVGGGGGSATNGGDINFQPSAGSTKNGVVVFNKAYTEERFSVTATASTTLNCTAGNNFNLTLSASITTLTFSNVPAAGRVYNMTLFINQGGSFTITWPAAVKWAGGTAPTLTTTSGKVDIVTLVTHDGGTNWYGFIAGQNF